MFKNTSKQYKVPLESIVLSLVYPRASKFLNFLSNRIFGRTVYLSATIVHI